MSTKTAPCPRTGSRYCQLYWQPRVRRRHLGHNHGLRLNGSKNSTPTQRSGRISTPHRSLASPPNKPETTVDNKHHQPAVTPPRAVTWPTWLTSHDYHQPLTEGRFGPTMTKAGAVTVAPAAALGDSNSEGFFHWNTSAAGAVLTVTVSKGLLCGPAVRAPSNGTLGQLALFSRRACSATPLRAWWPLPPLQVPSVRPGASSLETPPPASLHPAP